MRRCVAARDRAGYDPAQIKLTPEYVLDPVRAAMGGEIGLDPCTEPDNPTRAREFHALPDDGLSHRWIGRGPVWVNPPWGAAMHPWVVRAIETGQAGESVALLIPADTHNERQQAVLRGADAVTFLAGRVTFRMWSANGHQAFTWLHATMIATWNLRPIEGLGVTMVRV